MLRAALARDPDNAGVRLNLVAELPQEERLSDALALLDAARPPDNPAPARHWHLQRASILASLGRLEEARAALADLDALGETPPELGALRHWRLVGIALAEGRLETAQTEALVTEAALERDGASLVLEHRIMAHYDLAKFWSRLGTPAQAFALGRRATRSCA